MERRIVVSESQVDEIAERLHKQTSNSCANHPVIVKERLKDGLIQIFNEVKLLRTRRRIEIPDGCITIREASRKYGISSSTLAGWVSVGYIPPVKKTPRRTFILESEIAHLVDVYKKAPGRGKRTIEQFYTSLLD